MKRLLPLLALCACGDNLGTPTPVDMSYRVTVTELENGCGAPSPSEGAMPEVDARLWPDGTVELVSWSPTIPGPSSFPEIRVEGGRVDYRADRHSSVTGKTYPYRIEGSLSMEAVDLTIEERWYRYADGPRDCTRRARISGKARGHRDAASLDGRYPLLTEYFGEYCAGDPVPATPIGAQVLMLETDPRPEVLYAGLASALFFSGPPPDASGLVDWDGTFYLVGIEGIEDVPGTLAGTFRPDAVEAVLEFSTSDQAAGCRYRYALSGRKRVATTTEVGNDYRAVYRVNDGCSGTSYADYGLLEAVEQGEREVSFHDLYGDWYIDRDGATLHETDGSEAEGVIATFHGTAEPPYLAYKLEFRFLNSECAISHEVDAVARYFPETEWTPAFLPDEPDDGAAASALRSAMLSMAGFRGSDLGPLSK